jgi:ATP-dependent RNA helicase DeaD
MTNPATVTIGSKNSSAQNIKHVYCVTRRQDRYQALRRFIDFYPEFFGIVFCRTRNETKELSDKLMHDGYNVDALHGDLSQAQRDTVMQKLRHRKLSLLIATDVAARGIDISDITHVVHYSLPEKFENYTHRSGRTARAGKSGMSIALLSGSDVRRIKQIERIINTTIEHIQVPDGNAICAKQVEQCIQDITQASVDKTIAPQVSHILEKIGSSISKEQLVGIILGKELNTIMRRYKDAPDINDRESYNRSSGSGYGNRSFNRSRYTDRSDEYRNFGDKKRYGNNNYNRHGYKKYNQTGASHSAPIDRP